MPTYTECICTDGVGIMKDGELITIDQFLKYLNEATEKPSTTGSARTHCYGELLAKMENILYGIDKQECEDPLGWWETSTGAEFWRGKLELIRNLLK